MKDPQHSQIPAQRRHSQNFWQAILTVVSLLALAVTFLLSSSNFSFEIKVGSFAGLLIVYLVSCYTLYYFQNRRDARKIREGDATGSPFTSEIEHRLFALEEANKFFGTSLKPPDMFRLVASRVNELVPFAACVLLLKNEHSGALGAAFVDGKNAEALKDPATDYNKGLAGKSIISKNPQIDEGLVTEMASKPSVALEGFRSSIAAPLFRGIEVFGVLQLYSDRKFDADALTILEAISERVAPLFLSSRAFEKTLSNALTDTVTNLPNERAFYLLLENQVAECQRYRDERVLSIVSVDIKNFTELNNQFGHGVGDRVLSFAADVVKGQLRKMDFLARSVGDEFLAVLPTAPENVALEIVERIERVLATTPFEISDKQFTNLEFNFGWATFWKDGETAPELLQSALLRKQHAKSDEPSKVLWFPREYVN
jgi:diguanylate cyclase (GGDEF)-like protein